MPAALWDLLQRALAGDANAPPALAQRLTDTPFPTLLLAQCAVAHAGTPQHRAVLDGSLRDGPWANQVRLDLQPYQTLMPHDEAFDIAMRAALCTAPLGQHHARALRESPKRAVTSLLTALHATAEEAVATCQAVTALRRSITPSLHVLQAMALQRATTALGPLRSARVLEVGPQDGGLLHALEAKGAQVTAVDLAPRVHHPIMVQGDFMTAALQPPYDLVVATAVFEFGSGWVHTAPPGRSDLALLQRLRELLAPGGVAVVENIGYPVPFSPDVALDAGLVPVRGGLVHHLTEGGRGCTLRRTT